MRPVLTETVLDRIAQALVMESTEAWKAGAQNCPGPISPEGARRLILKAIYGEGAESRPCNCGSGIEWQNCHENDQFCG